MQLFSNEKMQQTTSLQKRATQSKPFGNFKIYTTAVGELDFF